MSRKAILFIRDHFKGAAQYFSFILLLIAFMLYKFLFTLIDKAPLPATVTGHLYNKIGGAFFAFQKVFDPKGQSIRRTELMEIALRNMKAKKVRTLITIGGMALGIGIIVFLVSIGYGLEQVVIGRVARLEELRQADVSPQPGGKVKINDKMVADFKNLQNVTSVLPMIALVGRVNYKDSISDMAVYGVTSDYLQQSAIKTYKGKIFNSNALVTKVSRSEEGEVAGAQTARQEAVYLQKIGEVNVSVEPGYWLRVREAPSPKAKLIGYTKRFEAPIPGVEVWGQSYPDNANGFAGAGVAGVLGKWVKAAVPIWKQKGGDYQEITTGYFAEVNLQIEVVNFNGPQVLGLSTEEVLSASGEGDFIELASESAAVVNPMKKIPLGQESLKEAVINKAALKVLGLEEDSAVGSGFKAAFVVVGNLTDKPDEKIESEPTEYTIVGVTPDEKTPVFYVPFIDLRSIGITTFSQLKVAVGKTANLSAVRKQIEGMGFVTRSVADTVAQIESLFATARTVLSLLGMVALGVAALGMFNTLTVSLMERTREVGLMKAMGMKSREVKELFLTESMMMGFFGGVFGLIAGFLLGKLLSLVLSVFTFSRGGGTIDVVYLPAGFVGTIMVLSFLVGVFTGMYPAKRATEISALDALRYE
jgi:ABC-type antimicrobial peptide transport system permease subunit